MSLSASFSYFSFVGVIRIGFILHEIIGSHRQKLMLLSFFHSPHPGNMMRTNDGKLAILDFGLVTEVTDNQKYGMIEAIESRLFRDWPGLYQS